jgi:hypothetical protein
MAIVHASHIESVSNTVRIAQRLRQDRITGSGQRQQRGGQGALGPIGQNDALRIRGDT